MKLNQNPSMAYVIIIFLLLLFSSLLISVASLQFQPLPPPLKPPAPQMQQPPQPMQHQSPTPMHIIMPPLKPSPQSPPSPQSSPEPLQPSPPPKQANLVHPPPPKLQRDPETAQERMNGILESLIGSGDFANWANLLTFSDPSLLPFTSTLFVPNNDAFSDSQATTGFDPFTFLYHVVPHRLSFSDLCLFRSNTRLPTLLPSNSILITNSSRLNFTIDGARITDPDLYSSDSVSVHGIGGLLDFQIYGGHEQVTSFPQNQAPAPIKEASGVPTMVHQTSKGETWRGRFAVAVAFCAISASVG